MKTWRVLLVTAPYHAGVVESAGRWPNLAFTYMAGELRAAGFEVEIYDAMTKGHTLEQVRLKVEETRPDIVATSAYTPAIYAAIGVMRAAREARPQCITVVGGVHATFCYREILETSGDVVDYVVRGEGEITLVELAQALRDDGGLASVQGIAYRRDARVISNVARPFMPCVDKLRPAWDLVEWEDYTLFPLEGSRLAIVETSRGCPFDCAFCSQQKFWNRRWRARSPEAVVADMEHLAKSYGVDVVMFSDEYPTADKGRWEALLNLLIERDLGINILMETRVRDIVRDAAIMEKYRRAGIIHLYVGVESTNQSTLDLFKKNLECEESMQALKLINDAGIISECSFVFGLPEDSPKTVETTLALARYYSPDMPHFLLIAPWPYSDIYAQLKDYIVTSDYSKYNFVEPVTRSKHMTAEELQSAVIDCYRRYYRDKMLDFLNGPAGFKRDYMFNSMRAMMKNSFLAKHLGSMQDIPGVVETAVSRTESNPNATAVATVAGFSERVADEKFRHGRSSEC